MSGDYAASASPNSLPGANVIKRFLSMIYIIYKFPYIYKFSY